jgi:hypothetical protein
MEEAYTLDMDQLSLVAISKRCEMKVSAFEVESVELVPKPR